MKKKIENILENLETLNNEMTQSDPSFDKALTNLKKIAKIKDELNKNFLKRSGGIKILKENEKGSFSITNFKED